MRYRIGFLMFTLLSSAPALHACSVPVYRYALERWAADPYRVELQHTGELTGDALAAAETLKRLAEEARNPESGRPNLWLRDEPTTPPQGSDARVTLYYPAVYQRPEPLWTAPIASEAIEEMIDSPARQEIAKRLMAGDAVVWVLLESGDAEKDGAAVKTLEEELAKLETTIHLPENPMEAASDAPASEDGPTLKIAYSFLRLAPNDPKERFLITSLLATEPDLLDFKAEPMAFPIFGRGRALYALVGRGINAETIGEACAFLTGACSCEVKEQNPGVDLLMRADWDKVLEDSLYREVEMPPLVGLATLSEAAPTSDALPSEPALLAQATTDSAGVEMVPMSEFMDDDEPLLRNMLIALGLLIVVSLALTFNSTKRRGKGA